MQKARLKINDNTQRENGSVESSTITVDSAQVTDVTYTAELAKHNAFVTAIMAISLGSLVEDEFAGFTTYTGVPAVPAVDPNAQRERKWKIIGYVNNGALGYPAWRRTVPCADITDLLANTEQLDPLSTSFTNLKTAVENYVLSSSGDPIVVTRVNLTGV